MTTQNIVDEVEQELRQQIREIVKKRIKQSILFVEDARLSVARAQERLAQREKDHQELLDTPIEQLLDEEKIKYLSSQHTQQTCREYITYPTCFGMTYLGGQQ